jgi:glycosyltransferase involved in cell wall biosynthesis
MYSLVIPVYRNEATIPLLLEELEGIDAELERNLEVVFVVDGSPDGSEGLLRESLPRCSFGSQLVSLSRNFGSFEAVRAGLAEAEGPYFAIVSADLQEPPELVPEFFRSLEREPVDVVIGIRSKRDDPLLSRWSAAVFWRLFRGLVQDEIPPGGVDVFGCSRPVRD